VLGEEEAVHLRREILVLGLLAVLLASWRQVNGATFNSAMEQCICSAVQALLSPQKTGTTTTLRGTGGNGVSRTDLVNFRNAVNSCINAHGGSDSKLYEEKFDCSIVDPLTGNITNFNIHLERARPGQTANVNDNPDSDPTKNVDITIGLGGAGSTSTNGGDGNATNNTPGGVAVGVGGDGRNNSTGSSGSTNGGQGRSTSTAGTSASAGGQGGQDRDNGQDGGDATSNSATGDTHAYGGPGGDPTDDTQAGGNGGAATADAGDVTPPPPALPNQTQPAGGGGPGTHGSGASASEGTGQGTTSTPNTSQPNGN